MEVTIQRLLLEWLWLEIILWVKAYGGCPLLPFACLVEVLLLLLHVVGYIVLLEAGWISLGYTACCWESRLLALLACLADVRPVAFVLDFGCSFGPQWSSIALCSWLLDFMLAFTSLVAAKCRKACVAAFLAAGFRIAGADE
ncbi:hypothetical protein NC653_031965 [Populus alba x Populus x berolinensis]|uniref:Uncharacterized protein n=2 Tax=Populus TaxID=3689 RepID=A0A4U5QIN1_POPAL|nr:hypothetical protein NC653_031965 [Populus alba x Populus x berolinensis]TKS08445.1 hypothetical protein D5086_0000103260 [Populus alba]